MDRGVRTWLLLPLSLAGLIIAATVFVRVVLVREAARRRMFPVLRPLYKHVFNPPVLRAAARGDTTWGVVHHVGRRSGTAFATPIDAQRTPDGVLIPVVYGLRADWCRNILAAGHCGLTLNGQELALTEPRVVPIAEVLAQLSPEKARFWSGIGIEHCMSLKTPAAQAQPTPMHRS
jgi:hypothetical protein